MAGNVATLEEHLPSALPIERGRRTMQPHRVSVDDGEGGKERGKGVRDQRGIEVRYLAMPRSGVDTPSYYKAVNVWCSDKPQEAMTQAKQGKSVPDKKCEHPVDRHLLTAQKLGVNATPTIITDNGGLMPGPAAALVRAPRSSSTNRIDGAESGNVASCWATSRSLRPSRNFRNWIGRVY